MISHSIRLIVSALLASSAAAQTTWFVDVHATAPGNGSHASPYTSIQYAIDRPTTLAHDTILVAPGIYVENVAEANQYPLRVISAGGPLVTELRPAHPNVATVSWSFYSTIEGFTLTGNTSIGVAALELAGGIAVHCIVRDNPGLGVYSDGGALRDCTIIDNGRGVLVEFFGAVQMSNTIVWSNQVFNVSFGAFPPYADYCAGALPAQTIGTGNIVGDPLVWNTPGARYRLRPGSPCIDAGDPNSPPDPDGTRADIGAIPYDPTYAPGPIVFCTGKINSQGCTPQIGFSGHATATGSAPFVVSASNELPGMSGLLFYGPGQQSQPFQGALLCAQFPLKRIGVQVASGSGPCGGTYSFDFGAYLASGSHPLLFPGALIACQWWSRDLQDPSGFGSGLSDALFFGVAP